MMGRKSSNRILESGNPDLKAPGARSQDARRICGLVIPLCLAALLSIMNVSCALSIPPVSASSDTLQITTSTLPSSKIQSAYHASLAIAGGTAPFSWSLSSGSLPTGLALAASSGEISGTPTRSGNFSITVEAKDSSAPPQTATKGFSLSVAAAASNLQITTSSLSSGQVGASYETSLAASGGTAPYSWSMNSGSLPTGLALAASSGEISGSPTQSGNFSFTVQVNDSSAQPQTATKGLSLSVAAATSNLQITTSSLSSGQVGASYGTSLAASGGTAPYSWSLSSGGLPPGLSLDASSGAISGTPTASGSFSFTAKVTDSTSPTKQTATKAFSVTIAAAVSGVTITTSSVPNGQVGSAYSTTLAANGGTVPYTWSISAGALPTGLALGAGNGVISGTPTASGNSSFTVQVKDAANNTATKPLSVSIVAAGPQPLQITTTSLPQASTSAAYSQTLQATGGTPGYTWSVVSGQLPTGLSLMAATGEITGTATTAGQSNFTVQVKDSAANPATATQALTLTVVVGVALDQYGGRTDIPCAQATGWFHTEEINSRWWLCTPLGNAFFLQGVGAWTPAVGAKYGNSAAAGTIASINEFQSWGFNAVGEDSYGLIEPVSSCQGCTKLPEIQTIAVSNYAAVNLWSYAQHPMKNLLWGLDGNYGGWRASFMDFFEPQFGVWLDGLFTQNSGFTVYATNHYFVGVMLDDTDWFWGMGAGPDFHTVPPGHNNSDVSYMVLLTSPVQTYNSDPGSRGVPEVYTDTKVYSKTAMANPPASCSIQTPCSLRDYLFQKYNGSIAALNTSWGSNYTTFDSSGTQVNGEVIGTGDGSTTTFTHTLSSATPSPESIQIVVNGVAAAGDVPWFQSGAARNTGGFGGPTLVGNGSTINYATGALAIQFTTAPAAGGSITVNYVACGWTCGTGLMDEDGRNRAWVGTNAICLTPALSCDGKDNPLPNANPNLGADLDTWISQFAGQYFGTLSTHMKAAVPHVLYFGADTVGTWGAPARKEILEGAAPFVDGLFTQWYASLPDPNTGQQMYSYLTQYLGDKPLLNFMTLNAQADSAMSAFPPDAQPSFATQALRGQQWNTTVSDMLNTPSFNNTFQWVGIVWWGSHDFANFEKTDWGLKTPTDNAYDGHEAVIATVPCSPPLQQYTCGGEAGNYGNAITSVTSANQLWLSIP